MLVSVGSGSNVDDADTHPREFHRADVLEYTPEGKFVEVYANGIRNCVGEAINPITGSALVLHQRARQPRQPPRPRLRHQRPEGSFFGWPWYYMGGHQDPRLPALRQRHRPQPAARRAADCRPGRELQARDISAKVNTPDVLVQPHMASLEMVFYPTQRQRSRRLRRRRLRRRARQLEPRQPRRLRSHLHPHARTATPPASTTTSSPASSPRTARSGAGP